MNRLEHAAPVVEVLDGWCRAHFRALGGPCELLMDGGDRALAAHLAALAADEAWRIERRYSRYRRDGEWQRLHAQPGRPVVVDDETAALLDYAAELHRVSDGRFDITSGALRRVWRFDGGTHVPSDAEIAAVLRDVGFEHVGWNRPELVLPQGFELDFGGIGKEYAVDRAAERVSREAHVPLLLNFGGDLVATGPRAGGRPWQVGVDDAQHTGRAATHRVELTRGALATSGDARRYVLHAGRRLGHILDPRTGWPVEQAPASVTVLAPTCLEAGSLATLAMLAGPDAEEFLRHQGVVHEVQRAAPVAVGTGLPVGS